MDSSEEVNLQQNIFWGLFSAADVDLSASIGPPDETFFVVVDGIIPK